MPRPIEFNLEPQFIQPFGPIVTYENLQTLEGISEFVKGTRCPKKRYSKPSIIKVADNDQ
jgi:hypothetical protein